MFCRPYITRQIFYFTALVVKFQLFCILEAADDYQFKPHLTGRRPTDKNVIYLFKLEGDAEVIFA